MRRGEIWMFRFAPPDKQRPVLLLTRSDMILDYVEQRPVLLLTRSDMIPVLNSVTVAPLTRTIRGVASEVVVGIDSGLKIESAINLHHLVTIPKGGLRRFIGAVPPAILARVRTALLFALGFE